MQYQYGETTAITAADGSRNFGRCQDAALKGPVVVTHHGRPRVVIVSAEHFANWKARGGGPEAGGLDFETGLAAVLNASSQGFISLSSDLRIVKMNGAALAYFEDSGLRLEGRYISEVFPKPNGSLFQDKITRVQRTGEHEQYEGQAPTRPDRYIRAHIFPYPGGIGVLFANITDEVANDRRLAWSAALSDAIRLSGSVATCEINIRGAIVEASPTLCATLALPADKLLGAHLADFVATSARHHLRGVVERVLRDGEAQRLRIDLLTRDGGLVPADCVMAPLREGHGVSGACIMLALRPGAELGPDAAPSAFDPVRAARL